MPTHSRFQTLAMPHMEAAFNLAFWIVRSRADAEDVVQEAYLRAFRGFDGFRGEDIRPWLLAIVRNAAYRWLSVRQRAGNVVSLDETYAGSAADEPAALQIASDEPTAEGRMIERAEGAQVMAALAEVPPVFREALVLREIEDMSYREIADVTGTPIGTVMSRLSRGRLELRKALLKRREKEDRNEL